MKWDSVLVAMSSAWVLTGCQSTWEPESNFGSSVKSAIRAQIVDPHAPASDAYAHARMDGESARKSVESYQKSFGASSTGDASQGSLMTIINK